jgi:hypothetical protein
VTEFVALELPAGNKKSNQPTQTKHWFGTDTPNRDSIVGFSTSTKFSSPARRTPQSSSSSPNLFSPAALTTPCIPNINLHFSICLGMYSRNRPAILSLSLPDLCGPQHFKLPLS